MLDLEVTSELKREGLMREVVRHVQSARKQAGLDVDNRIRLSLKTDDAQLHRAIDEHQAAIAKETLAEAISQPTIYTYQETVKIEGMQLHLSLEKISS